MKDISNFKSSLMRWTQTRYKRAVLALSFVLGISSLSNAQVNTYSFAQTSGTYTALTGGNILATATANTSADSLDSGNYSITGLPFSFYFNGVPYTDINVNTNGNITFGSTLPGTSNSSPISTTTAYDGAVSAFGRDINGVFDVAGLTSDIRYDIVGTAPNREIIIQWTNFRPTYVITTTTVYTFSFQIRLKETSNTISVVYKDGSYLVGTSSYNSTAQIGLRGFNNMDFNNRLNATTAAFTASTPGTANNSAQAFNTTNATPGMPTSGLTYTWTPPSCFAPSGLSASGITQNSASISWTAPATVPVNGYDVYYSTTNTAPDGSTVLTPANSVTAISTATSATLNGLTQSTQYYVWIRSKCGTSDMSGWSSVYPFKTECPAMTIMSENFDTYGTGNIVPDCWSRLAPATTPGSQTISSTTPASGTRNMYQYATTTQNPVIVVLPIFSNINAGTHWLRFKAKISSGTSGALTVGYMTDVADYASFTPIQTLTIDNTSYTVTGAEYTVAIPNTLPANARLAIKNAADGKSYYWDDVYWEIAPTCLPPSNLTVSAITAATALVSWTAPAIGTPMDYDIYYTTTNTAPTTSTVLDVTNSVISTSTSATINGLTPSTTYYVWVRSNCGSGNLSNWTPTAVMFSTECQPPALTGTTGATVCVNGIATLSATADPGATIIWYDAATAGNEVGTGTSFTTPVLPSTTNYWATASTGSSAYTGRTAPTSSSTWNLEAGIRFDALSPFVLESAEVYPGSYGDITVELRNSSGIPITSKIININSGSTTTPFTLPLNFAVPSGTGYYLVVLSMSGTTVSGLVRESSGGISFPYTVPGVVSITSGYLTTAHTSGTYYFFYNVKVSTKCESPRTVVTATVDTNCMGTSETDLAKSVKVYPNPFKDILNISDVDNIKTITVMDVSGRVVKTIEKVSSSLNLSDLKEGLYLVNLNYKDGKSTSVKVIKK